jgi:hypothetical protein
MKQGFALGVFCEIEEESERSDVRGVVKRGGKALI